MNPKTSDRRDFLKRGAAFAGLAVGASAASLPAAAVPALEKVDELHLYGERSHFVTSVRSGSANNPERRLAGEVRDFGLRTPLQDSAGIVTPNSLHYVVSHGYEPPDIDPREHRLLIHGMVDRPLILTMEELQRLPSVSRFHYIECHGNSTTGGLSGPARISPDATAADTHGATSCSQWTGVLLSTLLKEVGVQKSATWVVAEGADANKHSKSFPVEKAYEDALVAYAQNGEPVRPEQGFPLRLVLPGWQGIGNVKWLRRIQLSDQPSLGMMEISRYPRLLPDGKSRWFEFEMGPKSVITRPSGGQKLPGPGYFEITGLAWSGGGAIRRVEVSADGGKSWKDAKLHDPIASKSHTRFTAPWEWNGEEAVLQSRCTDDKGVVQPTLAEVAKNWGQDVEYLRQTNLITSDMNAIQPWKVNRDGSVKNAIY
jgi:sulfane dehydrogenase subunit SoxC